MKDWEISKSYVLPRILCLRAENNATPGKQYKPNLRFFSLHEACDKWTTWKRSDYFYPEIIPEPDYSDSGDEAGSEDDNDDGIPYYRDPTSTIERLRDLTEVYVSNVDLKKAPSRKTASPQVRPKPKADPKQTKETSKVGSDRPSKPAHKIPKDRRSPSPRSKTPTKDGPKPSPKVSKAKKVTATAQADKSSKTSAKTSQKAKSPPSVVTAPTAVVSKASPAKKTSPAASKRKPKVSPTDSKTKPTLASKQPSISPSKGVAAKPATTGKTSPKTAQKAKASSKEPDVAGPSGDAKDVTAKTPPSSPTSSKSKSPLHSAASTEQSSDDELLIKPRKPVNPYLQSTERQKLHKELKFSQKYGKLGASPKTELQLALERYTENKMKRELNAEEKTSFEKILEFQAKKIEMQETMDKSPAWVERLQKPIIEADPKTDEFYRVHARVVSSNTLTHCFLSDDDRSECSSPRKFTHSDSGSDS